MLIPIRFLRYPNRWVQAKPRQAGEQCSPLRAIDFSADKTITRGTDKSVPYKVRSKFCTNIEQPCVVRGTHGFARTLEPGYRNKCIRNILMRL